MVRACCLVAIRPEDVPRLTVAINAAFEEVKTTVAQPDIALLNALAPDIIAVDIDQLEIDPIEMLRQLRFVCPDSTIVAFTGSTDASLVRGCHNAGANCLLSKDSNGTQLSAGLRRGMRSGCYTDPHFGGTRLESSR
jgi:DNA-binding NarL/FixJ family response regulator